MATCSGGGDGGGLLGGSAVPVGRDELKSQFSTREGVYRLVSALELSRSIRPPVLPYGTMSTQPPAGGPAPPLRLSFVTLVSTNAGGPTESTSTLAHLDGDTERDDYSRTTTGQPLVSPGIDRLPLETDLDTSTDRFCFNLGKELFVYSFQGSRKIADLTKPLDKRVYKGTFPTCHEFNKMIANSENLSLLIGFSGGQIQLVEPVSKEVNKLYNEDRMIDKTRVTCIRWVPNSTNMFLVSHGSGQMYLYNIELTCGTTIPHYQVLKQGPGHVVSNCKSKTPRNPISRWTLGEGAINEFAFSPCGLFLALVSQDGFLRIFSYDSYELVGITRSYFGGLLCVCWSPDSKYICVGGEDDLVTIWSFRERRVVCRGQGHKSWVSVVAFDPYTTTYGDADVSDDCGHVNGLHHNTNHSGMNDTHSNSEFSYDPITCGTNSKTSCLDCASSQQNCGSPPPISNSSATSNKQNRERSHSVLNYNNSSDSSVLKNFLVNRYSRTSDSVNIRLSVSDTCGTRLPACYRVGSVSQDTQLCFWDLTEDVLKQPFGKSRPTTTTSARTHVDLDLSPSVLHSTSSRLGNSNHVQINGNSCPPNPSQGGKCLTSSASMVTSSHLHSNSVSRHDKDPVDSVVMVNSINNTSSESGAQGSRSNTTITETGTIKKGSGSTSSNENGNNGSSHNNNSSGHSHSILSLRFGGLSFGGDKHQDKETKNKDGKEHKRNFSLGSSSKSDKANHVTPNSKLGTGAQHSSGAHGNNSIGESLGLTPLNLDDPLKLIGTLACPRLDECPLLEPLICKKISHERLTNLIFREDSIITACQDGIICTWSRPGDDFKISNHNTRTKYPSTAQDDTEVLSRIYTSKGIENVEPL